MKRDMDLVRAILIATEQAEAGQPVTRLEGYSDIDFAYNASLMEQAGLIDAAIARAAGAGPVKAHVRSLTWDGHEFLDAVRSDSVWAKTKARIAESVGAASFDVLKAVAVSIAIKAATGHV